jgi:two-component system sensor histidine kinase HupT/HoxJ
VLNLLDNAIRAEADNIWLRVAGREGAVTVTVSDDGPGVDKEDAARIFDPFFSNRKDGSGSGLGLYLSRKMAEDYGGSLRYQTRMGGGAEFVIEVPAVGPANDTKR